MRANEQLPIGQIAQRVGLSVSAVRFYEDKGLIFATRSSGGTRLFPRHMIRRLSLILIAQRMGFSLAEIGAQLEGLPRDRAPTKKDWARISRHFAQDLDNRIATLTRMRDRLDGCIGCGCLSLKACTLYNPDDAVAVRGAGPRHLVV